MEKRKIVKVFCPLCKGHKELGMNEYPQGQGTAIVVCPQCKGQGYLITEEIAKLVGELVVSILPDIDINL